MTEDEDSKDLSCFLKPFLSWLSLSGLLITGLFSLLYKFVFEWQNLFESVSCFVRDVIVATAHHEETEDKQVLNAAYFMAVSG